ncbi:TfoX/Sxy family protein [Actinotalea sp. M2MS4P-6]|uniref:TfoX/Sxy family protein n=1 Tax=Actinotalea sp. M2MS4P-6 TaxID=2983762 RepID=UPI0021E3B3DC|nr:TfoX/Sxy family protein [Actinotalea sp. M2MS4P-6]MCV2395606.1 TfoX/Sxy family protein [Actinotalea sp. M2MS4P-6]
MPSFEKSPPDVVARFDELVGLVPDAVRRPMFGYPALFMNGNLFFSLFHASAVLRMSEADREDFAADHPLHIFEPMAGRKMKEYVVLPPDLFASPDVQPWLERSAAYARTIPPKPPRGTKR